MEFKHLGVCAFVFGFVFLPLSAVTAAPKATPQPVFADDFNYTNGVVVGQGGWTNYANGQNFLVQDALAYRKGKALYSGTGGDSIVYKTGTARPDGSQTIYVRTDNRSGWGAYPDGNAQIRISEGISFGSSIFLAVTLKADGNVTYYNPLTGSYENFATYRDNVWTKVQIEWRTSDNTARYKVNNGSWTNWLTFNGADQFTQFDNIGLDFVQPSGTGGIYFDAFQ